MDEIPYLLLTPGPLTTSPAVRRAMGRDWCTWDADYHAVVTDVRRKLAALAAADPGRYTAVPVQGSGTFAVEAAVGSLVPPGGKLLVASNGAYGERLAQIAGRLRIPCVEVAHAETEPLDPGRVDAALAADPAVTHVAAVHCETTTGMLNPAADIGRVARRRGKVYLVDAMSSLGGIPLTMEGLGADVLVSSANKCLQGVPGLAFAVVERGLLARSRGWARSLSLDLHAQWETMEREGGKWRYTSPTHAVAALAQALAELEAEGGVAARHRRYRANQALVAAVLRRAGFEPLLPPEHQSPIITACPYPADPNFSFDAFYLALKRRGFVIYPGKIGRTETFRVGNIGHIFPADIEALGRAVADALGELGLAPAGGGRSR